MYFELRKLSKHGEWEIREGDDGKVKVHKKHHEDTSVKIVEPQRLLCLIGTWKEVVDEHEAVENAIEQRGGWASWWSFPIEEDAQKLLTTPFYIYLNSGGGVFQYRMKVEEYRASRGNDGILSPWPDLTDDSCKRVKRAGISKSEIFKTWLRISAIEELEPPLTLDDMELADSLSHPTNVLNQGRFGYVYLKENPVQNPDTRNFWWLNYDSNRWDVAKVPIGHREVFTAYNEKRNKRQKYANFEHACEGDAVIAYETSPHQRITSLMRISKDLSDTPEGPGIEVELVERFTKNPVLETLKKDVRLVNCEIFQSGNRGTLFKLTETEYKAICDIIANMRVQEQVPLKCYSMQDALAEVFVGKEDFEDILDLLRYKKNVILQGPPGVGKTFIAKRLAYSMMGVVDTRRVEMIQFHQSYSYEDFIQGYRPNRNGGFERKNGIFFEFCQRAHDDNDRDYFFIIDEINRGNLSKIFGELLMLIESDKRNDKFSLPLTYSHPEDKRFYIPHNLHFIGTMNTADRSLAMVDYALRRRFCFVDLQPSFGDKFSAFLAGKNVPTALIKRIIERISQLNDSISSDHKNLGPGFCIGHSFFCPNGQIEKYDQNWFEMIVKREIAPLIKEYWFDDDSKAKQKIAALLAP
jgi:dynein-related subfamily AAA family protein